MSRQATTAALYSSLLLVAGCAKAPCEEAGREIRIDSIELVETNDGAGAEVQACGRYCVDVLGNVYDANDWASPLGMLPPEASRAMTRAVGVDLHFSCGDGGEVWALPSADAATWVQVATGSDENFTVGVPGDDTAMCVGISGSVELGEGASSQPHTAYPAAPTQYVFFVLEGRVVNVLLLADGSAWEVDTATFELVAPVLGDAWPLALLVSNDGTGMGVSRSGAVWSVERAEDLAGVQVNWPVDAVAAGAGRAMWVMGADGCLHVGPRGGTPEAELCVDSVGGVVAQASVIDRSSIDPYFFFQEDFTVRGSDGSQRTFHARLGNCLVE